MAMDMCTRLRHLFPLLVTLLVALFLLWLAPTVAAGGLKETAPGTTITVNTTADEHNSNNDCALREAVIAANTDTAVDGCPAGSGTDTILIPGGIYNLSLDGIGEDNAATGDLDIREAVTIQGQGLVSVRGGYGTGDFADRVFHVVAGTDGPVIFRTLGMSRGAMGGILTDSGTTVRLEEVDIQDNHQGVHSLGTLEVLSSTFGNNRLSVVSGSGAGLHSSGPTTIENSLFVNNRIVADGSNANGAGWAHTGSAPGSVNNSTFVGNGWVYILDTGYGLGAAIYATAPVTASNVTFGRHSYVDLLNMPTLLEGPVRLHNTIMNMTDEVMVGCSSEVVSLGYNLSTRGDCGMFTEEGDQLNVPPAWVNLQSLSDNGGPTFTMVLGPGSVAIDTGASNDCPATDQRGMTRPRDGNGNGSAECDRGAYEVQTAPPTAVTLTTLAVSGGRVPAGAMLLAVLATVGLLRLARKVTVGIALP
jgi:CSLREA domain-containing protein